MIVLRVLLSLLLFGLGVVAAFAAALWWYEQSPGRTRAKLLRAASIAVSAFAGFLLAVSVLVGLSPAELTSLWLTLLPMLAGVAAGIEGAHRTARRELELVIEGDAFEHWKRLLLESEGWWFRSRAARELAALEDRHDDAEAVLALAGRSEPHRRVRDSIGLARTRIREARADPGAAPPATSPSA